MYVLRISAIFVTFYNNKILNSNFKRVLIFDIQTVLDFGECKRDIYLKFFILWKMKKLGINDIFEEGKYKGKKVSSVVSNKKAIFDLLKTGCAFEDEVLEMAGIKKNVHDVKASTEVVEHEKDTKVYPKETESLAKILKEIEVLNDPTKYYDNSNDVSNETDNNKESESEE